MQRSLLASLMIPSALALLAPTAHAEPAAEGAASSAAPQTGDETRYAYLKSALDDLEPGTERWFTGWTWTYAWIAGGQALLGSQAPTSDLRAVSFVGAIEAAGGLGIMLLSPNTLRRDWKRVRSMPGSTPLEEYNRRVRAEEVLRAVAFEEAVQHNVLTHAGLLIATGAGAGILHYGFDLPILPSVLSWAGGFALAELNIWTRPFGGTNAWEGYKKGYHPADPHLAPAQYTITFAVTPMGVAAHGTF